MMVPWFERPIMFDIRTRPRTIVSLTGSRDLQMVNISVRTLVRPDEHKLAEIYQTLGLNYDEKVGDFLNSARRNRTLSWSSCWFVEVDTVMDVDHEAPLANDDHAHTSSAIDAQHARPLSAPRTPCLPRGTGGWKPSRTQRRPPATTMLLVRRGRTLLVRRPLLTPLLTPLRGGTARVHGHAGSWRWSRAWHPAK